LRTQGGVFGHIIHLAVATKFKPAPQSGTGGGHIGAGDAQFGKTQLPPPDFYFFDQCDPVDPASVLGQRIRIGVLPLHSPNHSPADSTTDEQSTLSLQLPDEAATIALGRQLAPLLAPGMVVWLDGDLGAGKTTLVRALLRGLGHTGPVKSPTYTLVEVYVVSSLYWYHFDFYRFNEAEEFEDAGLGEYFRDDSVCLVEWPDRALGYVPSPDLALVFRIADAPESGRSLELQARSAMGRQCLSALKTSQSGAAD